MILPFIEFGELVPGHFAFGAVLDVDARFGEFALRIALVKWTVEFGLRRAS